MKLCIENEVIVETTGGHASLINGEVERPY